MLDTALFRRFRDVAYRHAGIALKDGKESLVEARIQKRIAALGLDGPEAYVAKLERDRGGEEIVRFLDVISTNFTSFFREPDHFATLAEEANAWVAQGRRRVRVWCAASSTGEEPYTLAMTLAKAIPDPRADWRILATDISTRVLATARAGVYPEDRMAGVPPAFRAQWFARDHAGGPSTVRPALRDRVAFARLNLATPPFPMPGPLDAVFCRNVMIYFDERVRQGIVAEVERLLRPGGLFVVGHAETLHGLRTRLVPVRPSVFRRP